MFPTMFVAFVRIQSPPKTKAIRVPAIKATHYRTSVQDADAFSLMITGPNEQRVISLNVQALRLG